VRKGEWQVSNDEWIKGVVRFRVSGFSKKLRAELMTSKFIPFTLSALFFALCVTAEAQKPKNIPRVGFLSPSAISGKFLRIEAFKRGMQELGYIDGQNILIEHRTAAGKTAQFPKLVAELIALKVDVIVAVGAQAAQAAKQATNTIPIVATSGDPVGAGLVESLARPGGNVTGLANLSYDLAAKRLELLKEVVPKASRIAVIWSKDALNPARWIHEMEGAAAIMKIFLKPIEVKGPKDFDAVISTIKKQGHDGFIPLRDPHIVNQMKQVVLLAAKNRLPGVYDDRAFVEAGGLMSYGTDLADLDRRMAVYVDKILKGAKPADLPVEQPMKFELVINLKTAKQIGLMIPPNVLARANGVIR
jgi:putative ABC transport system substrate-binding protein